MTSLRLLFHPSLRLAACLLAACTILTAGANPVAEESKGFVKVEAENFAIQEKDGVRRWYIIRAGAAEPGVLPDGDPSHAETASGKAYIEVLPDTRRTHADKLVQGENFSNTPGVMAVLHYPIRFRTPGRYHVWVRAYSTGSEDNGIHVGLNGEWPESGQRMQWCEGKNAWTWASAQRTQKNHCGEPGKIWLDIPSAGVHTVSFSMREDGFEFDQFLLTTDPFYRP
jgi:hypothetical protein